MDYGRHHALPRKRRFPDAARKARRSRALSWGLLSLLRKAFVETAVLAALSLASKFRFLGPAASAGGRRCSIERLRRGEDEQTTGWSWPAAPPVRRAAPRLPSAPLGPRLIAPRGLRAKIKQMTAMPSERIAMGPLVWKRHIPTLPATPCDRF